MAPIRKTVYITNWKYLEKGDKYILTFKIRDMTREKRKIIINKHKAGILNSQGAEIEEIIEIDDDLFIKEYYGSKYFEIYKSLIPMAQKGTVPERLDPDKFKIELEMCLLELEMKQRMKNAARWFDLLTKHY